jgi:catechol 2,3-dioxygenase-like lactoylglutathione lyase family enzyme
MLNRFPLIARLAASDIGRAKAWYAEKLGLVPEVEEMGGQVLNYRTGDTWFALYQTPFAGTAQNTVAGWTVKGIEAVMAELRGRGVVFNDYDFGEIKTVDGLMSMGGYKAAWFTDSEGNIIELSQVPEGS